MWVEFVVGSHHCSKRFFSGYSGFPPSAKTNISKFQFELEAVERRATPWIPLKFPFSFFIYLLVPYLQDKKHLASSSVVLVDSQTSGIFLLLCNFMLDVVRSTAKNHGSWKGGILLCLALPRKYLFIKLMVYQYVVSPFIATIPI